MTVDTEAEKKGGDREEGARGWGRRHPHTPSLWADALKPPFPDSRPGPPQLATGWTRFRAERRAPGARCSAPPPAAAAADASAAAPPGLPPALAAPGEPRTSPAGDEAEEEKADAEVLTPSSSPPPHRPDLGCRPTSRARRREVDGRPGGNCNNNNDSNNNNSLPFLSAY
nr:elongin BC and Polycomb repressive complex 2-associated protein-like [Manis javanica]